MNQSHTLQNISPTIFFTRKSWVTLHSNQYDITAWWPKNLFLLLFTNTKVMSKHQALPFPKNKLPPIVTIKTTFFLSDGVLDCDGCDVIWWSDGGCIFFDSKVIKFYIPQVRKTKQNKQKHIGIKFEVKETFNWRENLKLQLLCIKHTETILTLHPTADELHYTENNVRGHL